MVIHRIAKPMSARRLAGPHRAVDWRDQMAQDLEAEDRAPVPGYHDPDVTLLTHFYRRRRDCQTMRDHDRLAKAMPDVLSAVNLHERAPVGVRTIVDAMVLANQPRESIVTRAGVNEGSIEYYESLFFDVRTRLHDSPFIIESVIGLRETGADSEQSAAAVVKLLSYYTGPASIDLLMIPRGDQWISIREVASKFARRARILLHLDTNRSEWLADPRRKQEMLRGIEAIEEYSGQYGDESVPRTEEQLVEAKRRVLDKVLMDRLRGVKPTNREGRDVQ
jgi:hypothetical protein